MLRLGALGAVTGEIAIGTAATSRSTTIIILTETTISIRTISIETTLIAAKETTIGSTIRNIVATRLTATEELRIGMAPTTASNQALVVQELVPVLAIGRAEERALATGQAVVQALAIVRGPELVPAIVPAVARAPAIVRAEARELVTVQAVAVPELDREVPPLKIKSAIAAHPHGLLPLLAAEEDLVVEVVETMREPAAIEAVTAWEAAE